MKNIAGQKFGRLTAIRPVGRSADKQVTWECLCDCGRTHVATGGHLRYGTTKSCGCLQVERRVTSNTKHGASAGGKPTPEYNVWASMIQRCEDPNQKSYPDYGGRGIAVCARWRADFAAFIADMGPRPTPQHSIDRMDGTRGYEPDNCKWSTRDEQNTNRRSVRLFTHAGETLSMKAWARRCGVGYLTLRARIEAGWDFERAISAPVRRTSPNVEGGAERPEAG